MNNRARNQKRTAPDFGDYGVNWIPFSREMILLQLESERGDI
jgi:hypothetical protein